MKALQSGDWVVIHWGDAHSTPGWIDAEELEKRHRAEPCSSIGWVYKSNKAGVSLYGSFTSNAFDEEKDHSFGECIFIPGGMIQKITVLKRAKKAARQK